MGFHNVAEVVAVLERHGIDRASYHNVDSFIAVVEQHLPDHVAAGRITARQRYWKPSPKSYFVSAFKT